MNSLWNLKLYTLSLSSSGGLNTSEIRASLLAEHKNNWGYRILRGTSPIHLSCQKRIRKPSSTTKEKCLAKVSHPSLILRHNPQPWALLQALVHQPWENLIQTFGIWFLTVWCGLFGWKEIDALLRILRNPWFNYKLYAKRLYLIGLGVGASQIVPLSWSLFLLLVLHFKFFLVVCFCLFVCCFSLCSPSWIPCICFLLFISLINNTLITYQKKEIL